MQSLGEIENSTENAGTISLVQEETKENEQLTLGNVGYIKLQIIDSGILYLYFIFRMWNFAIRNG